MDLRHDASNEMVLLMWEPKVNATYPDIEGEFVWVVEDGIYCIQVLLLFCRLKLLEF